MKKQGQTEAHDSLQQWKCNLFFLKNTQIVCFFLKSNKKFVVDFNIMFKKYEIKLSER